MFFAISMLMAGVMSCSNDDVKTMADESYISGMYGDDKLNITVDGVPLQNVTVNVTVKNGAATINLTGFPEDGATATWVSELKETEHGIECAGEYELPDGTQTYHYLALFQGAYGKTSCKIVCETVK